MKSTIGHIRRHPWVYVYALGLAIALAATIIEMLRGRNANYFVFADSTMDFWHGINPYTPEFVKAHGRYFLYTPVFSVLFWPIAALPRWLGPVVWNVANYTLFAISVFTLPKTYDRHKTKIFLFLMLVLEQGIFSFQYNVVVAYVFLFSFSLLERGRGFWAVLLIMLSATTKVYGVVELLLLFCYPKVFRRLCEAAAVGLALLLLPAVKVGFAVLWTCYADWWAILAEHESIATYASLLYTFPLHYLLDHYRIVQLVTVAFIIAVFFMRRSRWSEFGFRATTLGVLMGWIIVLGDSSETHTYLIALAGYMLWYWLKARHSAPDKAMLWLLVLFFGCVPVDVLVPAKVHNLLNGTLFIDVYLYAIVWCQMLWSMCQRGSLRR